MMSSSCKLNVFFLTANKLYTSFIYTVICIAYLLNKIVMCYKCPVQATSFVLEARPWPQGVLGDLLKVLVWVSVHTHSTPADIASDLRNLCCLKNVPSSLLLQLTVPEEKRRDGEALYHRFTVDELYSNLTDVRDLLVYSYAFRRVYLVE